MKRVEGKHLPHKITNEKEYNELINKDHFYVCLVVLGSGKDRFKRCLKPTKIVNIDNYKLIPEKGKEFSYDTSIYYFDGYEDCAEHFNQQIDEQSKYVKEQVEKIKAKYEQMVSMKVNIRECKMRRILK